MGVIDPMYTILVGVVAVPGAPPSRADGRAVMTPLLDCPVLSV